MEDFMIKKSYFTVAPVDSMVTVPPMGRLWSEAEKDGDGFVGCPTVWDVISSAICSDVISGTIMVIVVIIL